MSYWVADDSLMQAREWERIHRDGDEEQHGLIDLHDWLGYGQSHRWNQALDQNWDDSDNPRTLGLHWSHCGIQPSHFIGAVRLGEDADASPLIVRPRIQLQRMNFAAMFAEVLAAPSRHTGIKRLTDLFDCDLEQAPIDGEQFDQLTLLEVTAFLSSLATFTQRHLRQGFVRVRDNLVGRVRGRMLVSAQVRRNLVRAREDRMVCEYTQLSLDTLENRLLKAALQVASCWVDQQGADTPPALHTWIRIARTGLAPVPEHRVNPREWASVRKTGLMAAYAEPLHFARLVLNRLHLTPDGALLEEARTPAFYLNANQLFEAWVGVCLAHAGLDPRGQVEETVPINGCRAGAFLFRPDFVLDDAVVDAKCKPNGIDVTDLYQVIAYARLLTDQAVERLPFNEAWLIVPDLIEEQMPGHLGVDAAKDLFALHWQGREANATTWEFDGFQLGCFRAPVPVG